MAKLSARNSIQKKSTWKMLKLRLDSRPGLKLVECWETGQNEPHRTLNYLLVKMYQQARIATLVDQEATAIPELANVSSNADLERHWITLPAFVLKQQNFTIIAQPEYRFPHEIPFQIPRHQTTKPQEVELAFSRSFL